jgi:protein-tyrosine phosphatase
MVAQGVAQRSFHILTVCTGNICRSPLAEQLLRSGAAAWPQVTVSSAGTGALVDQPMPQQAARLSHEYGGDPSAHRARQLLAAQVAEADLVIAMSREHRREIVALLPRASRYTFTLRELARLLHDVAEQDLQDVAQLPAADTSARLSALVAVAASRRGLVQPPERPEDDDVIDPYRQSDEVYRASADQLVPAVRAVLTRFALTSDIGAAHDEPGKGAHVTN